MNSLNSVCYKSEILPIKHAKPNQPTDFVRYNRIFVITVVVITEFDSSIVEGLDLNLVVEAACLFFKVLFRSHSM